MKVRLYTLTSGLINLVLSVLAFFLVLRILFLFFSVNQATPIVTWVLTVSNFLITPFRGMVPNLNMTIGTLDVVALITLIVYLAIGYFLISLLEYPIEHERVEEDHQALAHYHHSR